MIKDTYFFSHDYNARNDKKMIHLKQVYKMSGIGIYWCIVEQLYEEGGEMSLKDLEVISTELKAKKEVVENIITGFDLFKNNGKIFWSESVKRRLVKRLEKVTQAKEAAQKRWRNATNNADALRTHTDRNAIKERKGKEIEKTNTGAAAQVVAKSFKEISEPEFIDQLAKFKEDYSSEMLRAFLRYWKEPNAKGKMKFQLEDTWDLKSRLETWKERGKDFKPINGAKPDQTAADYLEQRRKDEERLKLKIG